MVRGNTSMQRASIRRAQNARRRLASLAAAIGVLMAFAAGAAFAQTPGFGGTAMQFNTIDGRGVNLSLSSYAYSSSDVSLGGLSFGRDFYFSYDFPTGTGVYGWRHNQFGVVTTFNDIFGDWYYVSFGGSTQTFLDDGGGIEATDGSGATLAYSSGIYTHTSPNGTVTTFGSVINTGTSMVEGAAFVQTQTAPTGDKITWTYDTASCSGGVTCIRVSSVNSNTGYQLKIEYANDGTASNSPTSGWQTVTTVKALNNAVEYCDPASDNTCSYSYGWPTVTYANPSSGVYTVTDQDGRQTRLTFSTSGSHVVLTGIRSPESTAQSSSDDVTISYNTNAAPDEVSAGGRTWEYDLDYPSAYPNAGLYEILEGSGGAQTEESFVVQSSGRLSSYTSEAGLTTGWNRDSFGRAIETVRPSGVTVESVWAPNFGVETQTTDPVGALAELETTYAYAAGVDGSGNCTNAIVCRKPTTVTSPAGVATTYTYSTTHGGVLTSTTNSVTTTYDYDEVEAWYYKTGPSTIAEGDSVWRLVSVSTCIDATCAAADELKTTTTYQSGSASVATNALPVSVTTGAAGGGGPTRTATTTYDNWSRPVSVDGPLTTADGLANDSDDTTYTLYAPDNSWVMTIGPDPDGTGSLVRNAVKTIVNDNGNVTRTDNATATNATISDPDGEDGYTVLDYSMVAYDTYYRPIAQTFYTAGGTALSLVNTSYDAKGRVECVAYRMNPSVFGTPTAACTATTAGSSGPDRITRNVYNTKDQVITTIAHLGTPFETESHYSYTASGQVATFTDANGNMTTYEYDGFDRLVKTRYPDPSTPGTSSTSDYEETIYAANGRISSIRLRDESEVGQYTFDGSGRVTEYWIEGDGDSTVEAGEIKYAATYDQLGRTLTTERSWYDSGVLSETTTNAYDALNLTSVTNPLGGASRTVSYEYDAAGRRTKMTWPDSYYVTYDWGVTGLNSIKEGTSTTLASFAHDQRGRRTALYYGGDYSTKVASTTYAYDDRSRLDELAFNMDGAGTTYDLTRTFTFNQASQITTRSSSNSTQYDIPAPSGFGPLAYDANGLNQLTDIGSADLSYDGRGNLSVDDPDPGASNDEATYTFDLENQLTAYKPSPSSSTVQLAYDPVGRLSKTVGTSTTYFLYDGTDMIAEYDGSGNMTHRYLHGPGIDEPLVWTYVGWTSLYMLADERGSITTLGDPSGNTISVRSYDEYGAASATPNRFGYTGQMWIPEIGLYYYKARFYSPTQGRFLSPDPIGYGDGPNMYAYVGNDPINMTDPTGLEGGIYMGDICDDELRYLEDQIEGFSACSPLYAYEMGPTCQIAPEVCYDPVARAEEMFFNLFNGDWEFYDSYMAGRYAKSVLSGGGFIGGSPIFGMIVGGAEDCGTVMFPGDGGVSTIDNCGPGAYEFAQGHNKGTTIGLVAGSGAVVVGGACVLGAPGCAAAAGATAHGATRVAGAAATRGGVLNWFEIGLTRTFGRTLTQADGAVVKILTSGGRSNVVVQGQRGIITTFKNLSQQSVNRLANNYGWK
jgi:RHS repeat-associated protein